MAVENGSAAVRGSSCALWLCVRNVTGVPSAASPDLSWRTTYRSISIRVIRAIRGFSLDSLFGCGYAAPSPFVSFVDSCSLTAQPLRSNEGVTCGHNHEGLVGASGTRFSCCLSLRTAGGGCATLAFWLRFCVFWFRSDPPTRQRGLESGTFAIAPAHPLFAPLRVIRGFLQFDHSTALIHEVQRRRDLRSRYTKGWRDRIRRRLLLCAQARF